VAQDPTNPPYLDKDPTAPGADGGGAPFGVLRQCHPRLDLFRVKVLHALYRGGHHLLGNEEVMDHVFGKIGDERDIVYNERRRRAFYENLFAMVINQISAGLAQDPVHIAQNMTGKPDESASQKKYDIAIPDQEDQDAQDEQGDGDDQVVADDRPGSGDAGDGSGSRDDASGGDDDTDDEDDADDLKQDALDKAQDVVKDDVDPYWKALMDCATVPDEDGSEARSFDQVMRDWTVEAMVCGWAWLQGDLPAPDQDDTGLEIQPSSFAEQEQSGKLDAYLCSWPTDAVLDWEEEKGKLVWLRTYECKLPAPDPMTPRWPLDGGMRIHRWTIWTGDSWTQYEFRETKQNPATSLNDRSIIPQTATGTHSFGRVPWLRLDLCTPGTYLHVGDLIESLCRAYMNRQNGENWQWTQTCFQQLYEFLAPEMSGIDTPISQAQSNPDRARQRRSPGVVHERGENDRAEFVGPDMSGAAVGQKSTQDLRDAILRMTAQMALAQDTSGAMLRRSADSKAQDSIPQEIVLGAIGKRVLTGAKQAVQLLGQGRQDNEDDIPDLEGYEHFDVDDASNLIQDAVLLAQVEIPSARFKIESAFRVAAAHLGDNIAPSVLGEIRAQLETAITQDQVVNPPKPPMPPGFGTQDSDEDEDDEDVDEDSGSQEGDQSGKEDPLAQGSGPPKKRKAPPAFLKKGA